jgi:hypothetical protein
MTRPAPTKTDKTVLKEKQTLFLLNEQLEQQA